MSAIAAAYDASGPVWRSGPERVYERLATALLDRSPVDLIGARVLDVGAGTGVASRLARKRGCAGVVATDIAAGMLRQCGGDVARAVADAAALPFRDEVFDLAVVAFALGHFPDPVAALRETRRVARALVASAFAPSWGHPAKRAVDRAMAAYGFAVPGWYTALKAGENRVEDPVGLRRLAVRAGYRDAEVSEDEVDVGLTDPGSVVDWRWGMAHLAPFVATLSPGTRARARADAEAAVAALPPVIVPMLALAAD